MLEIALEVGYQSHEALTRAFCHEFGVTPQSYRRSRPALAGLEVFEGHGTDPEDKAKALWRAWTKDHPGQGRARRVFGHNIDAAGALAHGPAREGHCFLVSLEPDDDVGVPAVRTLPSGRFAVTGIEGNFTDDPDGRWIGQGWAKSDARWFEEELEPQTAGNLRLDLYLEVE